MNISRRGFTVVLWIGSSVGEILSGVKTAIDLSRDGFFERLNGWHVMFFIFSLMLLAMCLVAFFGWLNARFGDVETQINNEGQGRTKAIEALSAENLAAVRRLDDSIRALIPSSNIKTLQQRTLEFCNELRAFQRELGQEPSVEWKLENSPHEFLEANKPLLRREQQMHHGCTPVRQYCGHFMA
jgi:hypothetical protein